MLIAPMGNGKNVVNLVVTLKDKNLISKGAYVQGLNESEIVVGNKKFSNSLYSKNNNEFQDTVDFIRHHSLNSGRDTFTITTRQEKESTLYDVYSVPVPPKYINKGLDLLYGSSITDIRKSIPDSLKGREISLKRFGILDNFDRERMKKFRATSLSGDKDFSDFEDLKDILEFLRIFDFKIIEGSVISKEIIEYQLDCLKSCSTDTYKKLSRYYQTALDNEDIYRKLVYLHRCMYDKPYNLVHRDKEKEKIKLKERLYDKTA